MDNKPRFCTKCGSDVDPQTGLCPQCTNSKKKPMETAVKKEKGKTVAIILLASLLAVTLLIIGFLSAALILTYRNEDNETDEAAPFTEGEAQETDGKTEEKTTADENNTVEEKEPAEENNTVEEKEPVEEKNPEQPEQSEAPLIPSVTQKPPVLYGTAYSSTKEGYFSEPYIPNLVLGEDGSFALVENLAAGMGTYRGSYAIEGNQLILTVSSTDFSGFAGDGVRTIVFTINSPSSLTLQTTLCLSAAGDGFRS